MSALARWGGAFAGAVLVHAGATAALLAAVAPDDRPRPPEQPESRLELAVASVPRSEAPEVPGAAEPAPEAAPDQAALATGTVAAARARPVTTPAEPAPPLAPSAAAALPVAAPAARPALAAEPAQIAAAAPRPAAARPLAPNAALAGAIVPPTEQAPGVTAPAAPVAPLAVRADPAPAPTPQGLQTTALSPASDRLAPAPAYAQPFAALPSFGDSAAALAPRADRAPAASAGTVLTAALRPAPDRIAPADAPTEAAAPAPGTGEALAAEPPAAAPAPALPPPALAAPPGVAAPAPVPEVPPLAERATATTGWSAEPGAALQGATLDAVAAFLSPAPGAAGQDLRDGLRARLDGVDCARVQTVFDPDTGTVELRGHVPRREDGDRLVAAVEAELKGGLPVADRLLELPRPQCSVLAGLAAAGLAQSTEQFTNPLIIGPDAHARVYEFRGGQAMRLDIGGADYGGWLTLDYFDSEGNVVHLVPSGPVPELWLDPQETAAFGGGGPRDVTGGRLRVEIGPPYGKDIAVALVSSQPLFAAPRPPVEPADAYLSDLGRRVAELRAAHPDFKAEWVYLFVATSP